MSKINQDQGNDQGKKKTVNMKDDLWGRGLPTELLELILSKLIFVVDINNFHSVCKTWRSINVSVSPPRQLPSLLAYADSSFPLLFQITDPWFRPHRRKYSVFHPLYKYTWNMEFPPQVRDGCKNIYFSKYGWLLQLYSHPNPYILDQPYREYAILFNPLTQEIKELPRMPVFPGHPPCMFFTAPPSHPDCFVVAISGLNSSIYVHKLGEDDWKKHDLKGKMDPSFQPDCHPILYQGLCYCLDQNKNLAVFDIQDIENTWIVHDKLIPSELNVPFLILSALVEHNGQLLAVFIGVKDPPYVFELDLKRNLCVPMRSLGNNALFISKCASFSQRAVVSGTGNKIFFPFGLNKINDQSFRFYSLATGKYHSFFDNLSSDDLCGTEYLVDRSWLPM
ncbi:hypothetical protein COLO4_14754 [Corchorus olitorius]|uniref:KIB1-4 beta-propeller domain-containing protein n=1 Tax=Corchorus olitorius TaxID=93759 RepID=A0A1R3JQP4_9ROSI|nr:hypothetical protein COLO4_14754 [Corchorus olitorius]